MQVEHITIEYLRSVLTVDEANGKLFWLPRYEGMFPSKRAHSIWTALYVGKEAFTTIDRYGYRQGTLKGKRLRTHRVIWAMLNGYWPEMVDHIDGDRSNNTPSNLRGASSAENSANRGRQSNNTSGVAGVFWIGARNKWGARITKNGEICELGSFDEKQDAIDARVMAERSMGFSERHGSKCNG